MRNNPGLIVASLAFLAASCSGASSQAPPSRLVDVEAWRPLTTSYVPIVQLDNTVAIPQEARVSFAKYLTTIHQRFHPIFEESVNAARETYPEIRDRGDLIAHVEVALERDEGRIVRLGIARSSKSPIFDTLALVALRRAAPFGPPPPSIVSPDGRVYLHWEFHADPHEGCAPRNARPYLLATLP